MNLNINRKLYTEIVTNRFKM